MKDRGVIGLYVLSMPDKTNCSTFTFIVSNIMSPVNHIFGDITDISC